MEYNTQREHLPMPEYGRSVQEMIEHAVSITDRNERQKCAETIVGIMGGMFPALKDVRDFQVTLWDHLAYMSGYRLDIDYPYPLTRLDQVKKKPDPICYSDGVVRFKHYGRIVPELIGKAVSYPEGPERDQLVRLIVMQMKKDLVLWNKEVNVDSRIQEDLASFSNGILTVEDGVLSMELPRPGQQQQSRSSRFQRRKNRKRY